MADFPLLEWCRDAAKAETPNREVESGWWANVAPNVAETIIEQATDTEAIHGVLRFLQDPLIEDRFRFLSRDFRGDPCLRLHKALTALLTSAVPGSEPQTLKELFARAAVVGEAAPSDAYGIWASQLWAAELQRRTTTRLKRTTAFLISASGQTAKLSPFVVAPIQASWTGIKPHPALAASLVFSHQFETSIDLAWQAIRARHPESPVQSAVWWVEGAAREFPLDGNSHMGMLLLLFSALMTGEGLDSEFLASCSLDADSVHLKGVGAVRVKAKAALTPDPVTGRSRITRFFVHPDNLAQALDGAQDANADSSAIVCGTTLEEILSHADAGVGLLRRLSKKEFVRVFQLPESADAIEAADAAAQEWVPIRVQANEESLTQGSFEAVFPAFRRVLVEGDAGSGKSQLLKFLVAQSFLSFRPDSNGLVRSLADSRGVVFMRAEELLEICQQGEIGTSMVEGILSILNQRYRLSPDHVRPLLLSGRIMALIDGLDDLDHENAYELGRLLAHQMGQSPDLRFVTTVRTWTEAAAAITQPEIGKLRILPFGAEDIDAVIVAKTRNNEPLRLRVLKAAAASSLARFATSPLVVSLFIDAVRTSSSDGGFGAAPGKHLVYDRFISSSLNRIAMSGASRERALEALRTYSSIVAHDLLMKGYRDGHDARELERAEAACAAQYQNVFSRSLREDLLASGLLVLDRSGTPLYRFFHMSIGEYLAAMKLAAEFDRADERVRTKMAAEMVRKPNWRQALEFIPGHCKDPLRFLEELVDEAERSPRRATMVIIADIVRSLHAQPL